MVSGTKWECSHESKIDFFCYFAPKSDNNKITVSQNIFTRFSGPEELLRNYRTQKVHIIPEINGHIHTPHSFSAFKSIEQAFQLAKAEGVSVLGINDFYTTDGYEEFAALAVKHKIFPLFNIEFMALQSHLQEAGVRVNDPGNPGRTYFSGKGLRQRAAMSEDSFRKIGELQLESNRQTYEMVEKLNDFMAEIQVGIRFDAKALHQRLAKNLFRERHIAQAIRIGVFSFYEEDVDRKRILQKIFSGKEVKSPLENSAALENEIRGTLLKAGGAAFVPEDPKAFLSLDEVIDLIVDAGGIPCYPVLLDDPKGVCTDYEADKEKLMNELVKNDVYAIELIPGRNDFHIMKDFVTYFYRNGFVVTFGSEHNTPQLDPMRITCRGGVELDEDLKLINCEGTAIIAAHQYLVANGMEGYLNGKKAKIAEKEYFIELGKAVMNDFISPL
jgi:hypothetical protein